MSWSESKSTESQSLVWFGLSRTKPHQAFTSGWYYLTTQSHIQMWPHALVIVDETFPVEFIFLQRKKRFVQVWSHYLANQGVQFLLVRPLPRFALPCPALPCPALPMVVSRLVGGWLPHVNGLDLRWEVLKGSKRLLFPSLLDWKTFFSSFIAFHALSNWNELHFTQKSFFIFLWKIENHLFFWLQFGQKKSICLFSLSGWLMISKFSPNDRFFGKQDIF